MGAEMNDSIDDRGTREILSNSYLEMPDPEFTKAVMEKLNREGRRRQLLFNIVLNLFVFVAADLFIFLGLRLTGLTASQLPNAAAGLLEKVLSRGATYGTAVAGNGLPFSLLLSVGSVTTVLVVVEILLRSWKGRSHGAS